MFTQLIVINWHNRGTELLRLTSTRRFTMERVALFLQKKYDFNVEKDNVEMIDDYIEEMNID